MRFPWWVYTKADLLLNLGQGYCAFTVDKWTKSDSVHKKEGKKLLLVRNRDHILSDIFTPTWPIK